MVSDNFPQEQAMGDVKLLGLRASPFVNRVQIALNLKSINYEFLQESLRPKSELLLELNPVHKKVPVLIHGDKPISESLVIVEYIDEIWASGPSILPSDPHDRATARFWVAYIDDKLSSLLRNIIAARDEEEKLVAKNKVLDSLVLLEEAFIKCSKGRGFYGGYKIGYLDLALGCCLDWLKVIEKISDVKLFCETKTPNLVTWAKRFCSDDAVKDVIPRVEELMEYYKWLQETTDKAQSPN